MFDRPWFVASKHYNYTNMHSIDACRCVCVSSTHWLEPQIVKKNVSFVLCVESSDTRSQAAALNYNRSTFFFITIQTVSKYCVIALFALMTKQVNWALSSCCGVCVSTMSLNFPQYFSSIQQFFLFFFSLIYGISLF